MMADSYKIDGLIELLKRTEALSEAAKANFREASKVAAEPAVLAAQREVPVKSGKLRASIRSSPTTRGVRIKAGGVRVPYAKAVHFGHRRSELATMYRFRRADIKANPFLFRAVDQSKDEVAAIYLREIVKVWEAL